MFKKIGRFVTLSLFAAAAGVGTYLYLKNREAEDEFEDSGDDVNDDLEEFLKSEAEAAGETAEKREYVPLNFTRESDGADEPAPAEEAAEAVEEAVDAAAEAADEAADSVKDAMEDAGKFVQDAVSEVTEKASTFSFESFDASKSET